MTAELPALAALAMTGFMLGFIALLGLMVLVQPIWCIIDCAVDDRRSRGGKILWIIVLIVFYGIANWIYGAFAASGRLLRWLTRIAWVFAILLAIAFAAMYLSHAEFRRGIDLEWRQRRGMTAMHLLETEGSALRSVGHRAVPRYRPEVTGFQRQPNTMFVHPGSG